jgi:glycosyltransferase domain-containing protein
MDVSIVIPTMNRPAMLRRLIAYLASTGFGGEVLIGDSSSEAVFQSTGHAVARCQGNLTIRHIPLPGRSIAEAIKELNESLRTSYVCLVGDDDFVVPRTIGCCIAFLKDNPAYVAAHGVGVLITSPSSPNTIERAAPYKQPIAEENSAARRLAAHLGSYSVSLFAVHRTEAWRKMFGDIKTGQHAKYCKDAAFAAELLPCCLSVVYGKVKQVEGLYLVRQTHSQRYLLPNWLSWVSSSAWSGSYVYFRNCLSRELSTQDGIPLSEAETCVEQAFVVYFGNVVRKTLGRTPSPVRDRLQNYHLLQEGWRAVRSARDRMVPGNRLSLACLLSVESPYYTDFRPIYEAVSKVSE